METDVDDIMGEYSDDVHQNFSDDNSHSIYNNISFSNSTTVRLVSLISSILRGSDIFL